MPLEVLAHDGHWSCPDDRGTLAAFRDAWDHGFGIAFDVSPGTVGPVVSTVGPSADGAVTTGHVFAAARQARTATTIAIRLTDPSCATELVEQADHYGCAELLALDDGRRRADVASLPAPPAGSMAATTVPPARGPQAVPWLDLDWAGSEAFDTLARAMDALPRVHVVSPEIRRLDPRPCWGQLVSGRLELDRLAIATARPRAATKWFATMGVRVAA